MGHALDFFEPMVALNIAVQDDFVRRNRDAKAGHLSTLKNIIGEPLLNA